MFTFSPLTKIRSAQVNQNFTDLSTGDADVADNSLALFRADAFYDFVNSGLVWSLVSGLNGTMTSGVCYVKNPNGYTKRVVLATLASRTFTASKDTYIDIGSDGTVYYTEVANNGTSPALSANRIRIAIVITNGSTITQVNQGQMSATAPTVSSIILTVSDSLGNLVYNQSPIPTMLGYRYRTTTFTSTSNVPAEMTGLAIVVNIPNGARRKVRITTKARAVIVNAVANFFEYTVWSGAVGAGTLLRRTYVGGGTSGQHNTPDFSTVFEITGSATIRIAGTALDNVNSVQYQAGTSPYENLESTVELV